MSPLDVYKNILTLQALPRSSPLYASIKTNLKYHRVYLHVKY